ncbi:PREDICTED: proline-rich protein 1 [Tarenaya hassleriana]|uniref:proline-rich protein 1 n=1 Tax=Tarenaya hassleriana TaxID=28532 RepID=UPI00053C4FE0|nr:PREDICTED: proline-rich protein 1 [Tarenaya hassleriana]
MAPISPLFSAAVYAVLLLSSAALAHDTEGGGGDLLTTMIGVQGIIYCKRGSKLNPIQGAVARVTCETRDKYGYEAEEVTVLSQATDEKGYFMVTLSPSEVREEVKVKECRSFLELSPLDGCEVPTEINRGVSGSILSSYRLLLSGHSPPFKLFTVGPFVFALEETHDKSIPNGY